MQLACCSGVEPQRKAYLCTGLTVSPSIKCCQGFQNSQQHVQILSRHSQLALTACGATAGRGLSTAGWCCCYGRGGGPNDGQQEVVQVLQQGLQTPR